MKSTIHKLKKYIRRTMFAFPIFSLPIGSIAADLNTNSEKPNIVLLVIDDLGYGQLSCYPHVQDVYTPNLDAIANAGVLMTQGYSNDPMCAPTRQSLRSGMYFQRSSIGEKKDAIGKYFSDEGYRTACIGKSQFSGNPVDLGFDEFFGFRAGLHDFYESRIPRREEYMTLMQLVPKMGVDVRWGKDGIIYNIQRYGPILYNKKPVENYEHLTVEFTNRAIDWVKKNHKDPFFLYLSYNAIHHPQQAPEEYLNKRDPEADENSPLAQLAQLDCLDTEIGRLMIALDQYGLRENTLIIVVSDNGGLSYEGANWNLRGHKGRLWEGGIRVPFIASWPGVLPEGKIYEQPVIHMDIVPTILTAARLNVDIEKFDGKNLLPYWTGEKSGTPHETLFWGRADDRIAVRQGDWKLVKQPDSPLELYNIKNDISESENLIIAKPAISSRLLKEMSLWKEEMDK